MLTAKEAITMLEEMANFKYKKALGIENRIIETGEYDFGDQERVDILNREANLLDTAIMAIKHGGKA